MMDWNPSVAWWLASGVLIGAELVTGTFYLLMVALGCAAGAITAMAGTGLTSQIIVAAGVGAGATAAWHWRRSRMPRSLPAASNRDVNLDIGQVVHVSHWQHDGSARVSYRGAGWSVRYSGSGAPHPGDHTIVAVEGNQLQVAPAIRT